MKINSKDISFVIQGKNIKGQTKKCLKSIRRYFPEAEIIFSTYQNENVDNLDFDKIVFSPDPGAVAINKKSFNQLNRILLTTQEGLKTVKTKYCVRMRSDLIFKNASILNDWASKFPKRDKEYSIFKKRVCFFQLWTRLGQNICGHYIPTPFYFSDWFCFGLTEDIKKYFNSITLVKEPEFTTYFQYKKNCYDYNNFRRFDPEQYFGSSFFKLFFKEANLKDLQDFSLQKMEISKRILANNIVTLSYPECGIYIQKRPYSKIVKKTNYPENSKWLKDICTYYKFMNLYKQYCDPDFIFPLKYNWPEIYHIQTQLTKLLKHWYALKYPIKKFFRWVENIFSILYYSLKITLNLFYFSIIYGIKYLWHLLKQRGKT